MTFRDENVTNHGVYYERPATALTSHAQLKPGLEVWHLYLKFNWPPKRIVIQKVGTLEELGEPPYVGGKWFRGAEHNDVHSCRDCSLDGAEYNNNYLFASEADALAAIANRRKIEAAA